MPTYHIKCKKCGKVFDEYSTIDNRYKIKCMCGSTGVMWFGGLKRFAAHIWIPYLEENIKHQPVMIESKQHLKKLCKDNDVVAHRLD